jgi:hypothetical protein
MLNIEKQCNKKMNMLLLATNCEYIHANTKCKQSCNQSNIVVFSQFLFSPLTIE